MSTTSTTLGKHYERLTHRERLRMMVEAHAREDADEVDCLWRTCPRHVYRMPDGQFGDAEAALHKLTLALAGDLARHLAIVEGTDQFAACAAQLLLIAGAEAAEDVVSSAWPRQEEPEGPTAERLDGASRRWEWPKGGELDAMMRLATERTPMAHGVLLRLRNRVVRAQVVAVRSLLEGLSRFTRRVLGLEGIDALRAWAEPIAARIDALPPMDVAVDEGCAAAMEQACWKYWNESVTSGA